MPIFICCVLFFKSVIEYIAQMLFISALSVYFCIDTMMTINLLFSSVLAKRTIILEPLQIMLSDLNQYFSKIFP